MKILRSLLLTIILLIPFFAIAQVREKIDRGVVALNAGTRKVYISWRLLKEDPRNVAFNVYRKHMGYTDFEKINQSPVTGHTNFMDSTVAQGREYIYKITTLDNNTEKETLGEAYIFTNTRNQPWFSIKLQGDVVIKKVGVGDLDGDGAYDFVLQHPNFNVDPWHVYWERSPEPLKLEAYSSKGKFLWRYNMGWAIETGTWYAPYIVFDIDQDGKAEVYTKAGEGDPREMDGHVIQGPEYLVKLDGQTGKLITKRDWISKEGIIDYNYWNRNLLSVAYLDGINPSLIMERGTYTLIRIAALDKYLNTIWEWESSGEYKSYRGNGMHGLLTGDIDLDGKDELVFGTAAIDDNGIPLWNADLGHNDAGYIADVDPEHPGYEIFYGIESRLPKNGVCLVDAKSGEFIWGYEGKTYHVHNQGLIGDFTDRYPGLEFYAIDIGNEEDLSPQQFFLYNAKGERLSDKKLWEFGTFAVWWDDDEQKEIYYKNKVIEFDGEEKLEIEGVPLIIADIIGDWREEIVTSLPGELRIYSTNIPTGIKKTCLMQNHLYRMGVVDFSMGYFNSAQVGFK